MINSTVVELLLNKGEALFESPRVEIKFTDNIQANGLLNDLLNFPHAYVLACIMDRQIKAETAWIIPYFISERLGNFEFQSLADLDFEEIEKLMSDPTPLHRFPAEMSKNIYSKPLNNI